MHKFFIELVHSQYEMELNIESETYFDPMLVEQNHIIADVLKSRGIKVRKYKWDEYEAM